MPTWAAFRHQHKYHEIYSWPSTPVVDIFQFSRNEGSKLRKPYNEKIDAFFTGNVDIRCIIKSVSSLPSNLNRKITIRINEINNLKLSKILAVFLLLDAHRHDAVDLALHLIFSAALTPRHHKLLAASFLELEKSELLSRCSVTIPNVSFEAWDYLWRALARTPGSVHERLSKLVASEKDDIEKIASCLKPRHRQAWFRYRSTGLLLPYGYPVTEFTVANCFLLEDDSAYLGDPLADPLDGFDITEVLEVGASHGVAKNDIYGSLHTYMKQLLTKFVDQINTLNVRIYITNHDLPDLLQALSNGSNSSFWPRKIRFDRIDIGAVPVTTTKRIPVKDQISSLRPFLKNTKYATLSALFTAWNDDFYYSKGTSDEIQNYTESVRASIRSTDELRICCPLSSASLSAYASPRFQDTYPKFKIFLVSKLGKSLSKNRRDSHCVFPTRVGSLVGISQNSLPVDDFYWATCFGKRTHLERYVEWGSKSRDKVSLCTIF
jgi:Domain of unknown function (DUF4470)